MMDPNREIDLSDESLTPRHVVAREKGTLRRLIGSLSLFAIGYGDVGSSIYYALGVTTAWALGAAPVAIAIAGIFFIFTALTYAELSAAIPESGGAQVFARRAFGDIASFIAGWAALLIGFSEPNAAYALALIAYLNPFLPSQLFEDPFIQKGAAGLILLAITFLMVLGLRFGSRFHSAMTLLTLGLTISFATLVLLQTPARQNLEPILGGDLFPDLPSLGVATVMVLFAFSGWNAGVYIVEEIRRPSVYVYVSLLLCTFLIIAL